ncbi:M20/M25/M40 family metallo-hydrolase [Rhizosphaericola mali]|uniref:Carboxypeptidase Q n=1 Tax=Rhizosphaericola mali TaxID=2545455 RepID=A0A5P2G6N9_9BACT|nr:M20/M25/M40 family metallo-hydrolase [Rhizosphaericola mali]QES89602.1 M20/M25/M40 family metallo-hydrolase [Rhizosphaericola mali]
MLYLKLRQKKWLLIAGFSFIGSGIFAQKSVIDQMIQEEYKDSQLPLLGHELLDGIGSRLVGSPQMKKAHDWAVAKYASWDISAKNEQWGVWRGWERGISHIDMTAPWVRSLEGTQLAWSPSTKGKTIHGEVIILPHFKDSIEFKAWLPKVKGKMVMISYSQPTGRPDYNWEKFSLTPSFEKMKAERKAGQEEWTERIKASGFTAKTLPSILEKSGAIAILTNLWSQGFGVDKIFGANTKLIPTVDLSLEDYGLVYRLASSGNAPSLNIKTDSKETGIQPTFNTIATIKGSEKPNEYVVLSAHFDSWDGATGATDNGTGTLVMMEAMRLLKKYYPHPKRTIIVGHWGSEEEGLNGSRSFVKDHPEVVEGLQVALNQDNGTGRIVNIGGQGFVQSEKFLTKWLAAVPDTIKDTLHTSFPGTPSGGGSDNASFVAAGAPGISLGSLSWDYFSYTWHTNRDTYDKIVFDDVKRNVLITAILAYEASEDSEKFTHEKIAGPFKNGRNGKEESWPEAKDGIRKGGLD